MHIPTPLRKRARPCIPGRKSRKNTAKYGKRRDNGPTEVVIKFFSREAEGLFDATLAIIKNYVDAGFL